MTDENFNKIYAPLSGSGKKFKSKLDSTILQEKRERVALSAITGTLVIALCILTWAPLGRTSETFKEAASILDVGKRSMPREATVISESSVEYSKSVSGVRMYWVFR